MKKTKELKVQYQIRQRTYDEIIVPELRLMGLWLNKAGIKVGGKVQIEISEDQLLIKSVK